MILPETNTITLAETNDELVVDRSDRPYPLIDDLAKLLPAWMRDKRTDVTNAMLLAWGAMCLYAWAKYGQTTLALVSPRFAAGAWLDEWGNWYKRPRQPGESDGQFRARLLTPPQVVTPSAIRTAIDAIVAEYTPQKAAYLEPAEDAMFCKPLALGWSWACFVQPSNQRLWGHDPLAPHRTWGAYTTPKTPLPRLWIVLPGIGRGIGSSAYAAPPNNALSSSYCTAVASNAFAYAFAGGISLIDKVFSEIQARRASGVLALVFHDPLVGSAI